MVKDNTLYHRLGISSEATDSEIQKAFIGLSKKWHPDKHPEEKKEEATQKFKEIQEAKEILLDKNRRHVYDKVGMDIFNSNQTEPSGFPGFNGFNGFPNGFPFQDFPGFNGFPFQEKEDKTPPPIIATINVTIKQIYYEEKISFTYDYFKECVSCNGKGGVMTKCNSCDGKGKKVDIIRMGMMIQQIITNCTSCNGRGEVVLRNCVECKGETKTVLKNTVQLPLSSRLKTGDQIKMFNSGNHIKNRISDLIVQIMIEKDPIFTLQNNDLLITIKLSLNEALFGFKKEIPFFNDSLTIMSNCKTEYNDLKCLPNKGINQDGNLYLLFTFDLPDTQDKNEIVFQRTDQFESNMTDISKEMGKKLTILKMI